MAPSPLLTAMNPNLDDPYWASSQLRQQALPGAGTLQTSEPSPPPAQATGVGIGQKDLSQLERPSPAPSSRASESPNRLEGRDPKVQELRRVLKMLQFEQDQRLNGQHIQAITNTITSVYKDEDRLVSIVTRLGHQRQAIHHHHHAVDRLSHGRSTIQRGVIRR